MSRQRNRANKQSVRSHGLLVAVLVMVGLFASFLVYVKTRGDADSGTPRQVAAVDGEPTRGTSRQPKYDFYTDLPQRELVIPPPAQPEPPRAAAPPPEPSRRPDPPRQPEPPRQTPSQPAPPPQPAAPRETAPAQQATAASPRYLVQAGAFNLYSQADRARAQLNMLGIQARIEEGSRDGLPIYRVRIGPVSSDEADSINRRLSDNNIASIKLQAN